MIIQLAVDFENIYLFSIYCLNRLDVNTRDVRLYGFITALCNLQSLISITDINAIIGLINNMYSKLTYKMQNAIDKFNANGETITDVLPKYDNIKQIIKSLLCIIKICNRLMQYNISHNIIKICKDLSKKNNDVLLGQILVTEIITYNFDITNYTMVHPYNYIYTLLQEKNDNHDVIYMLKLIRIIVSVNKQNKIKDLFEEIQYWINLDLESCENVVKNFELPNEYDPFLVQEKTNALLDVYSEMVNKLFALTNTIKVREMASKLKPKLLEFLKYIEYVKDYHAYLIYHKIYAKFQYYPNLYLEYVEKENLYKLFEAIGDYKHAISLKTEELQCRRMIAYKCVDIRTFCIHIIKLIDVKTEIDNIAQKYNLINISAIASLNLAHSCVVYTRKIIRNKMLSEHRKKEIISPLLVLLNANIEIYNQNYFDYYTKFNDKVKEINEYVSVTMIPLIIGTA